MAQDGGEPQEAPRPAQQRQVDEASDPGGQAQSITMEAAAEERNKPSSTSRGSGRGQRKRAGAGRHYWSTSLRCLLVAVCPQSLSVSGAAAEAGGGAEEGGRGGSSKDGGSSENLVCWHSSPERSGAAGCQGAPAGGAGEEDL